MNKINISIKNLFRGLGIDNDEYEKLQRTNEELYIKTPENELTPILGFVKKKNNRILNVKLENGLSFKCSENHIIVTTEGPVNIKHAETLLTTKGFIKITSKTFVEENDVYDISLNHPHLYVTPNGIVHHNTSLAKIIVNDILNASYLYINASDENGIDAVRGKIVGFAKTKALDGKIKVVLLDEADNISLDGQKALRNVIEEFAINTRFILTCNYLFKVIPPLQSRCQIINLIPPVEGVVQKVVEILKKENVTIPSDQKPLLLERVRKSLPDLRRIINDIQKYSVTGTLQIRNDVSTGFAQTVYKKIVSKEKLTELRKYIIENEKEFSNDYRQLLKELFEVTFNSSMNEEVKSKWLLIIAKGMEADTFIVDKEIGCFATLLTLSHSNV